MRNTHEKGVNPAIHAPNFLHLLYHNMPLPGFAQHTLRVWGIQVGGSKAPLCVETFACNVSRYLLSRKGGDGADVAQGITQAL